MSDKIEKRSLYRRPFLNTSLAYSICCQKLAWPDFSLIVESSRLAFNITFPQVRAMSVILFNNPFIRFPRNVNLKFADKVLFHHFLYIFQGGFGRDDIAVSVFDCNTKNAQEFPFIERHSRTGRDAVALDQRK